MDVTIPCPCPPKADGAKRHEEDTVTLADSLTFRQATAIRNDVAFAKLDDPDMSSGEIMSTLTEGYILHGVSAWTLLDDKGKAVPVSKASVRERLLADPLLAEPIGEAADALYGPVVIAPLVARALTSSQPSPTGDSTSPRTSGPRQRPKPSKPSSTSTSGTDGIATITSLHVGDSKSLPSSGTAA